MISGIEFIYQLASVLFQKSGVNIEDNVVVYFNMVYYYTLFRNSDVIIELKLYHKIMCLNIYFKLHHITVHW